MYAIFWLVLIGVVSWLIEDLAGQNQYAQIIGAEPNALDMIMGLLGAAVACHLFPTRCPRGSRETKNIFELSSAI